MSRRALAIFEFNFLHLGVYSQVSAIFRCRIYVDHSCEKSATVLRCVAKQTSGNSYRPVPVEDVRSTQSGT